MRVAIEAASLSLTSGGLARYTSELSLALARCFPSDEFALISDQPFRMPDGAPPNLKRGGGPRNAVERRWWLWGIAREMARLGADLVHGQGLIPGGIAAASIDGRPRVVTARGNMRADSVAAYRGLAAAARARQRDRLARVAVEHADVIVGVNPDWAINVPERPKRFAHIPNIVDDEFFDRGRKPEPARVLFAGGGKLIKGWSLLAAAWPRVLRSIPDAGLNAVGWRSGEEPPAIPPEHQPSVVVEGALSSTELADRMARAAVLVIPSQFEVSPIVLAEAWAMSLPVVAARVGGVPALATGAAILVERDVDSLFEGLLAALAGGEEIGRLVAEGRRRAEAHRADAVATAHISLYEELRQGQ